MIFRIVDFDKKSNTYEVASDTGENQIVTAPQILQVMISGYVFDNAYLTSKGFAIKTPTGTRYIQLNINRETQRVISSILAKRKEEEAKQREFNQTQQKQITNARRNQMKRVAIGTEVISKVNSKSKTTGNVKDKITHRGEIYFSVEQLCRKYDTDVNSFRTLRAKGYTLDESLGLVELRLESELIPIKKLDNVLDSLARQRGEY